MTTKEANDIAKIYIVSPLLLGNSFDAENLSLEDNEKVQKAVEDICMKLLKQTKVGSTAVTTYDAVNMVLNNK